MPRMLLTEEEAAFVEKMRVKNAQDLGFNAGIEEARSMVISFMESKGQNNVNWGEDLDRVLAGLKRPLRG